MIMLRLAPDEQRIEEARMKIPSPDLTLFTILVAISLALFEFLWVKKKPVNP
jgi:hypothetical protein